jgi:hypothetical protein
MSWILYRHPTDRMTTLFETDDLTNATFVLQGVVINDDAELIDFSGDLDGALDVVLDGVRLTDPVTA